MKITVSLRNDSLLWIYGLRLLSRRAAFTIEKGIQLQKSDISNCFSALSSCLAAKLPAAQVKVESLQQISALAPF